MTKALLKKYSNIVIDRQGTQPNSNMTTIDIIDEIKPDTYYEITKNKLRESFEIDDYEPQLTRKISFNIDDIPKCVLANEWKKFINKNVCDTQKSNILGYSDTWNITDDYLHNGKLHIPIADFEYLPFYNCTLYKHGQVVKLNIANELPISKVVIGDHYIKNYIMKNAGGVYLEYHDRPHFHMPLEKRNDNGHLILGKIIGDNIYVSAFAIPYGYAIFTPNNVIHNDCFLKGEYLVVYSKTNKYSTMLLKNKNNEPLWVKIEHSS